MGTRRLSLNDDDRRILALAIPALGALAADPVVSMVDTLFVSELGTAALAALGINTSIFGVAFVMFNFLATGTTSQIADARGRGAHGEVLQVTLSALLLAVCVGVVGAGLLLVGAPWFADWMGARGELEEPTLAYLRIRSLAAPAVLLVTAGHGIYRGLGDTVTPLRFTLLLNAVNLALDPLLIFGLGWGISGAAWATVGAQWTGAVAFLLSLRVHLGLGLQRASWRQVRSLLIIGGALSVRTFVLAMTLATATALATRQGEQVVAAHHVLSQVWLFFALVVDALAVSGQTLIAEELGRDQTSVALRITWRVSLHGVAVGCGLATFLFMVSPWLPGWFSDERPVQDLISIGLPVVVMMQPLNAVVFVWDGVLMGASRFQYIAVAMVLSASSGALMLWLAVYLEGGLLGIWLALVVFMAARFLTLGVPLWTRQVP